uniref:Uncharacterized protein n=1 Tax=Myotis myotis TaxID=51298 RepID=A0A7J7WW49_MYOMY|nr:hypothetical protein mMyoMyo1_011992 [Myotis myotis]
MGPACPVTSPAPRARHGDLAQAGSVHPGAHMAGRSYLKADGWTVIVNATRVPRASDLLPASLHTSQGSRSALRRPPAPFRAVLRWEVARTLQPPQGGGPLWLPAAASRGQPAGDSRAGLLLTSWLRAVNRMQMANAQTFTTNAGG